MIFICSDTVGSISSNGLFYGLEFSFDEIEPTRFRINSTIKDLIKNGAKNGNN